MKTGMLLAALVAVAVSGPATAGDVDKGAVIGGGIGGGLGAAVGSKVGGTAGAAIGGAIGGATGAAIGSDGGSRERVIVKERVVRRDVRVVDGHDDDDHPPGHRRGKKKGWKKHRHD